MPFHPSSSLAKLIDTPVRPGKVTWIGIRPAHRAAMRVVQDTQLETGRGLVGDRYSRLDGGRQVTLMQSESLATIASHLGRESVPPQDLRRNIITMGINLMALKGRRFRIGQVVFETSGECHPCSRMEETLGAGGYNAVRGLGGITARVIEGGQIRVGDPVEPLPSLGAAADPLTSQPGLFHDE
jgi:MOSC domain-containing protein YiiM